jgi:hypothetical protein
VKWSLRLAIALSDLEYVFNTFYYCKYCPMIWVINDVGTRLSASITLLLVATTFKLIVSSYVPKNAYTFLDRYVIGSFIYILILTILFTISPSITNINIIDNNIYINNTVNSDNFTIKTISLDNFIFIIINIFWILFHLYIITLSIKYVKLNNNEEDPDYMVIKENEKKCKILWH